MSTLGDWIDTKPSDLHALKADLQEIGLRLAALEGNAPGLAGFHFIDADPAAELGADGDAALHTGTGYIWRKETGSWASTGFSVWQDGQAKSVTADETITSDLGRKSLAKEGRT